MMNVAGELPNQVPRESTVAQPKEDGTTRLPTHHQCPPRAAQSSAHIPEHIRLDEQDVDEQLELNAEDEGRRQPPLSPTSPSSGSRTPPKRTVVSFQHGDPTNPVNWPWGKKLYILAISAIVVMNSTIGSGLASGAGDQITAYFHLTSNAEVVLPTSIFLVGYILGPLFWGPLSETYGRKWIMMSAFFGFTVFSMAAALSPTFAGLIVFRFLVGMFGSCPVAVVGGICADVYNEPTARGRSMACFMAATTLGPILGPIISGYIATVSWRWPFWVGFIGAGATWIPLIVMPETYAPVILKKRARQLRKETDDPNIVAPIELEDKSLRHTCVIVLTRPIRMFVFEPIVLFTCLYLALAYGLFYMFFQSYSIIYGNTYGFTAGQTGLTFLPISIGAIFACALYLAYDAFLDRARAAHQPWARSEESRRLPLACLAGPFLVISLFWAGWSAHAHAPWIVPVLSGIPFGVGYLLIFMALINYLVDAYAVFAASALAAASTVRSVCGAVLPFAARPLYARLGVAGACSLLGGLCVVMCGVPFVFWRCGEGIRRRSGFCQYLARRREEEEEEEVEKGEGGDGGCARVAPDSSRSSVVGVEVEGEGEGEGEKEKEKEMDVEA